MPPTPPPDNTPAPANSAKKPRDSFQRYDTSLMEEDWKLGYQLAEQEALMMLRRLAVEDLQKKHDSELMSSDTHEGLRMTKLDDATKAARSKQSDRIVEESNASVGGNKEMRLWLGIYRNGKNYAELEEQRDMLESELKKLRHKQNSFSIYLICGLVAVPMVFFSLFAILDMAWLSISTLISTFSLSGMDRNVIEKFGLVFLFAPYIYWFFWYEKKMLSRIEDMSSRLQAVYMVMAENRER